MSYKKRDRDIDMMMKELKLTVPHENVVDVKPLPQFVIQASYANVAPKRECNPQHIFIMKHRVAWFEMRKVRCEHTCDYICEKCRTYALTKDGKHIAIEKLTNEQLKNFNELSISRDEMHDLVALFPWGTFRMSLKMMPYNDGLMLDFVLIHSLKYEGKN